MSTLLSDNERGVPRTILPLTYLDIIGNSGRAIETRLPAIAATGRRPIAAIRK